MFVDSATLQDLEVVPARAGRGASLWALIDRTRTRAGSQALRARLVNPPHTADEITALQRAHQALAAKAVSYRHALDRAVLDDVDRYLDSKWQLPRHMPRIVRFRGWYRAYREDAERGRAAVASMLAAAAGLHQDLGRTDAALLQELAAEIRSLMEEPDTQELWRLSSPATPLFDFDQRARELVRPSLTRLLDCLGRVEALWSVGVATAEHGWTYPQFSSRLRVSGLFHPFLGRDSVANDIALDRQVRVCFVTGPNMAGKSTFLKAIAIATLLAHAGSGVPATAMEFAPVGTVFSSVQIADDLAGGESFYLSEVRRIGALAAALADHGSAVAVLDEPFRGTNVQDAAEATLAVIQRLAAHPAALVLVASHLADVVPAIRDDPRIAFLCFGADLSGDQPRFDYRLHAGVSAQRLGMTLLRQEGVLERLERLASGTVSVAASEYRP